MPVVKCQCGNTTNTAVSDYWAARSFDPLQPGITETDKVANECYAALVNGKWEKGCGFDRAAPDIKKFVLELIRRPPDVRVRVMFQK